MCLCVYEHKQEGGPSYIRSLVRQNSGGLTALVSDQGSGGREHLWGQMSNVSQCRDVGVAGVKVRLGGKSPGGQDLRCLESE